MGCIYLSLPDFNGGLSKSPLKGMHDQLHPTQNGGYVITYPCPNPYKSC